MRKHWIFFYKPFKYYDHKPLKPIYLYQHIPKRMQRYFIDLFQKRHARYKIQRRYDVNGLFFDSVRALQ
jgi:hypothetical protein